MKFPKAKREDLLLVFIDFVVICIAFKSFLLEYYSVDSYSTLYSADQGARFHLTNGRFVLTACIWLFNLLKISMVHNSAVFNIIYFIIVSCCIFVSSKKVEKLFFEKKNRDINLLEKIILNAGFVIGYCNLFSAEWLYFNMCTIQFIFSILFATIGAVGLFKNKFGFLISLISLFFSYNSYQIGLGIYVWLVLIFIYLESDGWFTKKVFIHLFEAVGVCLLNFILNILILKIFIRFSVISSAERYSSLTIGNIFSNIKILLQNQNLIWIKGDGLTSFPLLFGMIILLFGLCIYFLIKNKSSFLNIFFIFILIFGGLGTTFMPILMPPFFWCSPRQIMPLFFLFTFLIVVLIVQNGGVASQIKSVLVCGELTFILSTVFFIQTYTADVLLINKLDKQRAFEIKDYISDYEISSETKIKFLGFYEDMYPTWKYDLHLPYCWDVCSTMFMPEWSNCNGMNYYTNSCYLTTPVPDAIKKQFKEKNWNSLIPEKQIIFDGDKCYICNY